MIPRLCFSAVVGVVTNNIAIENVCPKHVGVVTNNIAIENACPKHVGDNINLGAISRLSKCRAGIVITHVQKK